jgi:hypothetical protein
MPRSMIRCIGWVKYEKIACRTRNLAGSLLPRAIRPADIVFAATKYKISADGHPPKENR